MPISTLSDELLADLLGRFHAVWAEARRIHDEELSPAERRRVELEAPDDLDASLAELAGVIARSVKPDLQAFVIAVIAGGRNHLAERTRPAADDAVPIQIRPSIARDDAEELTVADLADRVRRLERVIAGAAAFTGAGLDDAV